MGGAGSAYCSRRAISNFLVVGILSAISAQVTPHNDTFSQRGNLY